MFDKRGWIWIWREGSPSTTGPSGSSSAPPRDIFDPKVFQHVSLIAFFAWVGLGADGISSSAYGPEETFLALENHAVLAIFISIAMVLSIFIISGSYTQIIKAFPTGGGGYNVASKLLGERVGVVSGSALVIDYVLTVTISVAAGADALFSFVPLPWASYKLWSMAFVLLLLIWLNLRGVKESVIALTPIFIVFIVSHFLLVFYAVLRHVPDLPRVSAQVSTDLSAAVNEMGWLGVAALLTRAYSMGAGIYTGIEAVSNSVQTLREPRVHTAKKATTWRSPYPSSPEGSPWDTFSMEFRPYPGKRSTQCCSTDCSRISGQARLHR